MPAKITNLDTNYIIEKYASGIGIGGVANMLGVSPSPIERTLRENGVHIRNPSEQQQARMDRSTPEEIAKLTKAANKAATGRKKTFEELCKGAKTREGNIDTHTVSKLEHSFAAMFDDANIKYTRQVACGAYNCDFVVDSVAVEVWGGNFHFSGEHLARSEERFKYITRFFKGVIIVTINSSNPFSEGLVKALIANIKEFSGQPSITGEYRMIWSNGEFITGNRINGDNFAFIYPFGSRRNTRSGCY